MYNFSYQFGLVKANLLIIIITCLFYGYIRAMKSLKGILALLLAGLLFTALHCKIGSAPPAGNFLSPFTGFWQNAENGNSLSGKLDLGELESSVTVLYDSTRVPHIFADNEKDLYFTQGYITAADRLWQMEFQTMAAAGRVSRSEEHTSELPSLMRISYAVFCLKKKQELHN